MSISSFSIIPGFLESPIIIHVPHAGTVIPVEAEKDILLSREELSSEVFTMADTKTDKIAWAVYEKIETKPKLFINNLSRLVIDPERFPDEREEMNSVGMGAVYTRTSSNDILRNEDTNRDRHLIAKYFAPYSAALEAEVAETLDRHGTCIIIDLHSYGISPLPYELYKEDARPNICLGTDDIHTPTALLDAAKGSFPNTWTLAINQPFAGTYVPLKFYGVDSRVQSIMLEIRKDSYGYGENSTTEFSSCITAISKFLEQIFE